jgi:hypothetical protein
LAVVGIYAGTYVVAIIVDRSNRLLKRLRGKSMGWEELEDQLKSGRGTLIYMGSGIFGSVWWTPDEEDVATSHDAREHAVLVRCPWRFRKAAGLRKVFPTARVAAFDSSGFD